MSVILGRRGTGKTTLACRLAKDWPSWRVYVHDPWTDELFEKFHKCSLTNPPATRDVLVILDECQELLERNGDFKAKWIKDLVWGGRHLRVALICIALRPQFLNRTITSQATRVFIGALSGAKDLEYCVKEWGDDCLQAAGLPVGSFLEITR